MSNIPALHPHKYTRGVKLITTQAHSIINDAQPQVLSVQPIVSAWIVLNVYS